MKIASSEFVGPLDKHQLPPIPGVYVIVDLGLDSKILYVGESNDVFDRLNKQEHDGQDCSISRSSTGLVHYYYHHQASRNMRLSLETAVRVLYNPPCNKQ